MNFFRRTWKRYLLWRNPPYATAQAQKVQIKKVDIDEKDMGSLQRAFGPGEGGGGGL